MWRAQVYATNRVCRQHYLKGLKLWSESAPRAMRAEYESAQAALKDVDRQIEVLEAERARLRARCGVLCEQLSAHPLVSTDADTPTVASGGGGASGGASGRRRRRARSGGAASNTRPRRSISPTAKTAKAPVAREAEPPSAAESAPPPHAPASAPASAPVPAPQPPLASLREAEGVPTAVPLSSAARPS